MITAVIFAICCIAIGHVNSTEYTTIAQLTVISQLIRYIHCTVEGKDDAACVK